MQKWASSTACKEQGEKHWRGDAHGVEAMRGEGATVTLAKPQGPFHPRNSGRGPTSLPQLCPNKPCKWTVPDGHEGFRATRSQLWLVSTWMQFVPRHGCSASGPGCWKSPVLPAQRLCPMQGHQPAPSQLCTPAVGPGGTAMPGWGHWPRDHCTLSQDNEARVPPEQQRAQTDEKKEGRKEGGMLGS